MLTICDLEGKKPQISYPCEWQYKIVVDGDLPAKEEVEKVLEGKNFTFKESHKSSEGKYESYNISLTVENEEERLKIFDALKTISKYVL